MPLPPLTGDIFHTQAQAVALGINANGKYETTPLYTVLKDRYPVYISACSKRARANLLVPGSIWVWREGTPWIVSLVVREMPQGATRLRYVEAAMLALLNQWQREAITSLALMRLGTVQEWPHVQPVIEPYLARMTLPVTIYEGFAPGVRAELPPGE